LNESTLHIDITNPDFVNQLLLDPTTKETIEQVVRRIIAGSNDYIRDNYYEDLKQIGYIESIKIIRSFWMKHPPSTPIDEWHRYHYASLYSNLIHEYATKYRGYKYKKNAPVGKRYHRPLFLREFNTSLIEDSKENNPLENNLLAKEMKAEILDFVGRKKSHWAVVMEMKINGYSEVEIADALGITLHNVKNLFRRGKERASQWRSIQNIG